MRAWGNAFVLEEWSHDEGTEGKRLSILDSSQALFILSPEIMYVMM